MSELLTIAFASRPADPAGDSSACGQARVEIDAERGAARVLHVVFGRGELLASGAEIAAVDHPSAGDGIVKAGPLELAGGPVDRRWSARLQGGEGAFSLELAPAGPPIRFGSDGAAAEGPGDPAVQPCRVQGTVTVAGRALSFDGIGETTRRSAPSELAHGLALARELDAWLEDGTAVALRAGRPAERPGEHDAELVSAYLIEQEPPQVERVDEARVSGAFTPAGVPLRAGLELWRHPDSDYPTRAAGQAICAARVHSGGERGWPALDWDCAFLDWRMEGRRGPAVYSLLRQSGS